MSSGSNVTSRPLVDPELHGLIDGFPEMNLSDATLPEIRERMQGLLIAPWLPDLPVTCGEVAIPAGDDGRMIRCLLIQRRDQASNVPAVLHFHGGGHIFGAPEMNQPMLMKWASAVGCLILSVDYRLAPETPFPGPMDDAYAALRWLHESADALCIDRARIGVAGESAGGAMAACLCLLARDRGEYAIAFQHLEMPRLSDVLPEPPHRVTGEFIWRAADSRYCHAAYLAGSTSPYASAARASDLAELPPAYIMVGALDLFVTECLAYSARLIEAGVAVELIVYPGCVHGFTMARKAAVTKRASADSLRALHHLTRK